MSLDDLEQVPEIFKFALLLYLLTFPVSSRIFASRASPFNCRYGFGLLASGWSIEESLLGLSFEQQLKNENLARVRGLDVGSADGTIVLLLPPLRDAVVAECVPAIYTKYHFLFLVIFEE